MEDDRAFAFVEAVLKPMNTDEGHAVNCGNRRRHPGLSRSARNGPKFVRSGGQSAYPKEPMLDYFRVTCTSTSGLPKR